MVICECLDEVVKTRYSVRVFEDKPVPRELIEKILEAGVRAPTAGGGEQWFFIVAEKEGVRREIHKLLVEAHKLYATRVLREPLSEDKVSKWISRMESGMYLAPVYIACYIDLRRRLYSDEYLELERTWAIQSLSAAIENMILEAWNHGLGCVWLGVPLLMKKEFDALLKPPENCELQAIIAIGYPAMKGKAKPRRSLSEVVEYK